jgi:hypothetical protein
VPHTEITLPGLYSFCMRSSIALPRPSTVFFCLISPKYYTSVLVGDNPIAARTCSAGVFSGAQGDTIGPVRMSAAWTPLADLEELPRHYRANVESRCNCIALANLRVMLFTRRVVPPPIFAELLANK